MKSQGLLLSVNMLFTGHVKELLWLDCCPMELVQDGEEWMVFSDSMKMGRLDGLDGLDVHRFSGASNPIIRSFMI